MKYLLPSIVFAAGFAAAHLVGAAGAQPQQQVPAPVKVAAPNPNIDFQGYLGIALEAEKHRAKRRLTEEDFTKMSREKGVIILDARSKEKFDLLHVKGAVNLSFPDIDVESLKKTLPDKEAKILIYCNNNFTAGAPSGVTVTPGGVQGKAAAAFPSKAPALSLNISTYTALYGYGYRNVYELGPLVDPAKTELELVSTSK